MLRNTGGRGGVGFKWKCWGKEEGKEKDGGIGWGRGGREVYSRRWCGGRVRKAEEKRANEEKREILLHAVKRDGWEKKHAKQ